MENHSSQWGKKFDQIKMKIGRKKKRQSRAEPFHCFVIKGDQGIKSTWAEQGITVLFALENIRPITTQKCGYNSDAKMFVFLNPVG